MTVRIADDQTVVGRLPGAGQFHQVVKAAVQKVGRLPQAADYGSRPYGRANHQT